MNRQPPPRRRSARIAAAHGGGGGDTTLRERILRRPDGYIGSPEKRSTQTFWINDGYYMVPREVTYRPGLHRIFDEVLVHAASNKRRDPSMDTLSVEVDVVERSVSVFYNGRGVVPVDLVDEERGVYAPEMFFGHLHDDDEEDDQNKATNDGGGGYGVKLANLFSTEFIIETADGCRMKKYKQVSEPILSTHSLLSLGSVTPSQINSTVPNLILPSFFNILMSLIFFINV